MGIFDKFKSGFKKSASAFSSGLKNIVVKTEIDDKTLDKIEDYLIQSDVGIAAASEIREIVSQTKIDPNKDTADEINTILKNYIIELMKPLENFEFFKKKQKLNAILISGVNGVGKTTTIGKISKIFKGNGNKVMLAASDTFRAAAIEQLENWSKKVDSEAPHDVILVLDATSGQNVINQVEEFNKIIPITGLIMTKLDGTAKGGILLAVAKKYKLPIIALGLGEKEDDLQIFEAEKFAEAFTQTN